MGRLRKADAAKEKRILAKPPKPDHDYTEIVNGITNDAGKRAAMMRELAELDEMIRHLRPYVIRGLAGAVSQSLKAKKQRAELLRLDVVEQKRMGDGEADVPMWAPRVEGAPPPAPAPQDSDDVDLAAPVAPAPSGHG